MTAPTAAAATAAPRPAVWGSLLLGFSMGGFFDGILLHQILQWHHLLSGYQAGALSDLRVQVMADGLFHALMYLVGMVGLWMMYRARNLPALPRKRLLGNFLIGFGIWHAVDAVLSHWLAGIHRIRMDVPNPLPWDLGWLVLFGVIPLLAGVVLRRHGGPPDDAAGGRPGLALLMGALVISAAFANLVPVRPAPQDTAVVVLRPGVPAAALYAELDGSAANVVWADNGGGVWVLNALSFRQRLALYRAGAMYVSGAAVPAGCAAWLTSVPPGGAT